MYVCMYVCIVCMCVCMYVCEINMTFVVKVCALFFHKNIDVSIFHSHPERTGLSIMYKRAPNNQCSYSSFS